MPTDYEYAKQAFEEQERKYHVGAMNNPDYVQRRMLYMQKFIDGFMACLDVLEKIRNEE